MFDEAKRQRAVGPAIEARHEALSIIHPLQQNIHAWQLQTAQLMGLSSRTRGEGSHRHRYLDEAYKLLREVVAARSSLRRQLADLSPAVAKSSRVVDTMRALNSVVAGLNEVVSKLEVPMNILRNRMDSDDDQISANPRR